MMIIILSVPWFFTIASFGIGLTVASTGVFPLTVSYLTFSFGVRQSMQEDLHNSQKTPNKKQAYWFDFERLRLVKVPVGSRVVVTSSSKCCLVKGMPTRIVLGFRMSKCHDLSRCPNCEASSGFRRWLPAGRFWL